MNDAFDIRKRNEENRLRNLRNRKRHVKITLPPLPPPPEIQSVGLPPERHAARVVTEMAEWLVQKLSHLNAAFKGMHVLAKRQQLGNPISQRRYADRMIKAGGEAFLAVELATGKRAHFHLCVTCWSVYDPIRDRIVVAGDIMPGKPWLQCYSIHLVSSPPDEPQRHNITQFFITHHAMQRLAERCGARTVDDLMIVMKILWQAECERIVDGEEAQEWRHPVAGGFAVFWRDPETHDVLVKTVLGPNMVE